MEINAPLDEYHEISCALRDFVDQGLRGLRYGISQWRMRPCPPHPELCDGYPHDWDIQEVPHRHGTREYTVCSNCGAEAGQPTFPPREEV